MFKLIGAVAAAAMLALAVPAPAAAGISNRAWSQPDGRYADGACDLEFVDYGEHLYLNDNLADGSGCYGQYTFEPYGSGIHEMFNSNGAGKTVHHNLELAEGITISFYVCARDDGYIILSTCSGWRHATA
jgi:hypothetical protein